MKMRSFCCAVATVVAGSVLAETLTVTSANSPFVISVDATYDGIVINGNGELVVSNKVTLSTGTLTVGENGKGTMTVTDGSTVNVTTTGGEKQNAPFKIANGVDSEGHFNLLDGSKITASYGLFSMSTRAKSYLTISNAQLVVNNSVYNTRNIDNSGARTNSIIRLQQGGSFSFGTFVRNSPGTTTLFQFDGGVCTNAGQYLASLDGGWLVFEGVNGHPIDYAVLGGKDDGSANGYFILDGNTASYGTPHVRLTGNGGVRLYSPVSRRAASKTGTVPELSAVTSDYTGDLVITSKRLTQSAPNQLFSAKNRIVLDGGNGATAVFDLNGFDAECAGLVESNNCYVLNPVSRNAATLTVGADNGNSAIKTLLCQSPVTVRKVGTGRLDLYSDNGYDLAPALTVEQGTVDLYGRDACGYKCYKWVITGTYGKNPNQDYLRISELEMFDAAGNKIDFSRVVGGVNSSALKDGNLNSDQFFQKFDFDNREPYFSIHFANPVQVSSYRLGTGEDYGTETKWGGRADKVPDLVPPAYDVTMCRDPSDWTVYGSDDGYNWVEIDKVADYKAPNNRRVWGPSHTLDYASPLTSGELKVFPGATLNVKCGKRLVFTGADVRGTVNYAEDVTVELKDGALFADLSGAGAGSIATLVTSGSGDAQMLSTRTVSDAVKVAAGSLVFGQNGGVTNKYWRLRLKNARDWWYDPAKWGVAVNFPGGYYRTDAMVIREMALWDKDGQLVTSGASIVSKPATMKSDTANALINGNTGDTCWMTYTTTLSETEDNKVLRAELDKPETWITYVIRLADDAKSVCSYDFFTHSDHSDRDPGAWDLSVSDDGTNWTVIEEHNEVASGEYVYRLQSTSNPCGRQTYGTYNRGEPLYFAHGLVPMALTGPGYAPTATVELGANTSLTVAGNGNVTGSIKVDAAQLADGVLTYLNPAAGGTLEVDNLVPVSGAQPLPFGVTTGTNLDNLQSWTVMVNGTVKRWNAIVCNGRLVLEKPGVFLLFR